MSWKARQHGIQKRGTDRLVSGATLVLAALMLLQPLLSAVHLASADHGHRLNSALGLYEDIVVTGRRTRSSRASSSPVEQVWSANNAERQGVSFTVCLTSNLSQFRYTASASCQGFVQARFERQPYPVTALERLGNSPVFMTAPKQSPPTA